MAVIYDFELAFGGDEFNYRDFELPGLQSSVRYVGAFNASVAGIAYRLHEFEAEEPIVKVRGRPGGIRRVQIGIGDGDPADTRARGYTARVMWFDDEAGEMRPVGRAVLLRL